MLTKYDEYNCHQIMDTMDHILYSDRAFTEKYWMNVHDKTGEIVMATGFGYYPNRNVMDGFGCVNISNKAQYNMRLSRELRPKTDELVVGPLSWEVVEPLKRIHVALDKNEYGISYDLEFIGRMSAHEEIPQVRRDKGRTFMNTCRMSQLGTAKGWIKVDGKKYDVDEDSWRAQRDHSWGIRMGVGAPEQGVQSPDISFFFNLMINWLTAQFKDWGVMYYLIEKSDGTVEYLSGAVTYGFGKNKEEVPIVKVDHDFKYHPGSARMKSGSVVLHTADGKKKEISMKQLTTMRLLKKVVSSHIL
ncbi:MAG: hypothetical protein U9N44_03755, partial [Chloroflexota bacterium]|nr:hypothetical protein [Chloroflexota bacterium]